MQWATCLRYITASYAALEALMINQHAGSTLDCSNGLDGSQVDALTDSLVNASAFQKLMIEQLKGPQPG